ncbi:MAG: alpha-N-arabinofuranosidase [Clostridia bacterium]|nr:alpha-N-arabinofuranosidase [Clostridia bacterium]
MKITCKKSNLIGQADKMLYGHFLEHFHTQTYGGVYDPTSKFADEDGFRTDVLEALKKIKTPIIRWPGGCYVSAYDWHYGVGKTRVPTFDKAWRTEESNEFGTDEFVKLCRKLECEPYICTNAGTGTAEEMSDWVEYCNLKDMGRFAKERIENGYAEPHNVKYWSIGNENWGSHEIGAKDADEWARLVRESAKMMIRVDPTIELSAASIENLDWNVSLLRQAGKYLDLISIHGYWERASDGKTFSDYNTAMLRTGDDITDRINKVRAYLVAFGLDKKIKIAYDEWNYRGWYHPNVIDPERTLKDRYTEEFYENEVINARDINDINSVYTMADAVFSASFLNACLKNCDIVKMTCFSPIVNTRGAIFTHENGIVLRPQYFVFELYSNLLKDTVLDIWRENVPTMSGVFRNVKKVVDTVDVVVTYGDGEYAIAAVNKDPENEQNIELSIIEDAVSEYRIHTVNGSSTDSYNDVGRTEVGITVTPWIPYNGIITLSPHSVNVIELKCY